MAAYYFAGELFATEPVRSPRDRTRPGGLGRPPRGALARPLDRRRLRGRRRGDRRPDRTAAAILPADHPAGAGRGRAPGLRVRDPPPPGEARHPPRHAPPRP